MVSPSKMILSPQRRVPLLCWLLIIAASPVGGWAQSLSSAAAAGPTQVDSSAVDLRLHADSLAVSSHGADLDDRSPWLVQGDSLVAEGRGKEALAAYMTQVPEHGEDVELWLRLSAVRTALGDPKGGIEAAQKARQLDPHSADAALMLAQAQFTARDPRSAISTLEAGIAQHPQDLLLLEAMATLKIAMEQWSDAAGVLRQLILINPSNAMYYMDLGRIQHRVGEMDHAYGSLQEALKLGSPPAPTLAILGHVCLALGRLDEAEANFDESLSLQPSAEAWSGRAGLSFLRGDAAQAETDFRKSLELNPKDADTWFNLGNSLVVQERPGEAEEAYRRVIDLDHGPSSAAARLNLGVLLLTRQKVDEAEKLLKEAARLNPELPGPHLHLARIAGARFRYDEARRHYLDYQRVVPDKKEKNRIDGVLADLQEKIEERNAAVTRGELHLLQIMTDERAKAEEALSRVNSGEDFYTIGQELSQLAGITGVDIGYVNPGDLSGDFRDSIMNLKVDETTPVLQGPKGWYLFQRVQ